MGLIREPENIDLAVIDKPWTDEEKKDFVRKKFKQELISHLEFYLAQVNNIIR